MLKNKKYTQALEKIDSLLKNSPDYDMINKNIKEAQFINRPFDSDDSEDKNLLNDPINTGFDLISPQRMAIINKARDHINTARSFLKDNKSGPAVNSYREALKLTPEWVELMNELAWVLATSQNSYMISENEAITLSGLACEAVKNNNAQYLDTFAAAYARAGKFKYARGIAKIALKKAEIDNNTDLAEKIKKRISLYKDNKPFIISE
jgi:tetratricopeptide (TPR) repeat protein